MAVRLKELERLFYTEGHNVFLPGETITPSSPLNQIKRNYYMAYIGLGYGASESLDSLEKQWLIKIADDDGQIPTSEVSSLWKQAVLSKGKTPLTKVNQNKMIFFLASISSLPVTVGT